MSPIAADYSTSSYRGEREVVFDNVLVLQKKDSWGVFWRVGRVKGTIQVFLA